MRTPPSARAGRLLAVTAGAVLLLAACGGGAAPSTSSTVAAAPMTAAAAAPQSLAMAPSAAPSATTATVPPASLAQLLGQPAGATPAADGVLVAGSADLPAGRPLRVPVGVLEQDGTPVHADADRVDLYAVATGGEPLGPFPAAFSPLGTATADEPAAEAIYVAHDVTVPAPGTYTIVAVYHEHGVRHTALGRLRFGSAESTPAVGAKAPASATPTLADVGGDAARLTTREPPDTSLLTDSVADLLAAHRPFVLVFATPRFCTSRICGPVVDVALAVQKQLAGTPMRFVHVEIYEGNDPDKGPNTWVQEWRLPTEPWVFVVGADGRIAAKFEGAVGVDELTRAARAALSP